MAKHVRMLCFASALMACLFLPASHAFGQDREEGQGYGRTARASRNTEGDKEALTATGMGLISKQEPDQAKAYLQAYQVAKMDALRNLLMQVDQVQIDSHSVGANFELKDDTIRAELKGRLRGAKVTSERIVTMGNGRLLELTVSMAPPSEERSTGFARPETRPEIRVEAPTQWHNTEGGSRRSAAAPVQKSPPDCPPRTSQRSAPASLPLETPPSLPSRKNTYQPPVREAYTAVIIDTRGLHLERSMSPRIRRADGRAIWGNLEVDPDWLIEHGIVVYAHSVQEARNNLRAGERPLLLHATGRGGGEYPSDPVLSNSDATSLLQANDVSGFLEKFRVIFVVDAEK